MKTFRNFVNELVELNDTEWELVNNILEIRYFKKGELISYKNDIWTDFIYINSGLIRSYIINDEGKDFTRQFYFNNNESSIINLFAMDLTSLIVQIPSYRGFEVLFDSEVIVFSRKNLSSLFSISKKFIHLERIATELAYLHTDNDYYNLLTKSKKKRFLYLQKTMPKLIKKVPQYHIATYLGMTPVSLSRIKKTLK